MPSVAQIDGLNIPGGAPAISAPAAAYSVRLLDSALGVPTYTGAAMRVRRVTGAGQAGNDDEADVGFDSNNILSLESPVSNFSANGSNATTLGQFLNVGTVNSITYTDADSLAPNTAAAYVDGWKDQSGNGNDAEQTAPANQPQIHDGTADTDLILENGKPIIKRISVQSGLSTSLTGNSTFYIFAACKVYGTDASQLLSDSGDQYTWLLAARNFSFLQIVSNQFGSPTYYHNSSVTTYANQQVVLQEAQSQSLFSIAADSSSVTVGYTFGQNSSQQGGIYGQYSMQEVLIYHSDESSNRTDIEDNINEEYLIYQPTTQPTSGLLYDYGSATGGTDAAAAYSVRQLSDKAVLCMRIRRDMGPGNPGDDDEINIGFDANGDLDTQAISDFCGTGTGWVTRWWDQSVNGNHADQPIGGTGSNGSQPQIYNGTAVITENGKPFLKFRGGNGGSESLSMTTAVTCETMFSVVANDTAGFLAYYLYSTSGNVGFYSGGTFQASANGPGVLAGATIASISGTVTGQTLLYNDHNGTGWEVGQDGGTASQAIASTNKTIDQIVRPSTNLQVEKFQECIIWDSDNSSNRTGIETNIDTYYQIP